MKHHCFACLRIRTTPCVPADDLVAVCHDILNRDLNIQILPVHGLHHRLITRHIGRIAAWPIVIVEIGSHILSDHGCVFPIDKLLKVRSDKLLVIFQLLLGRHLCLFISF